MRILGIDYGDSRIGVAVSDPFGWTAQALETINWNYKLEKPLEIICKYISQYKVEKVVVGFPRNMNGTIGPRGEKTQLFIDEISARVDVEVIKWDERLSTVSANRTMHEIGIKTSKKKQIVDQIAAVYILQGFLENIRNKQEKNI